MSALALVVCCVASLALCTTLQPTWHDGTCASRARATSHGASGHAHEVLLDLDAGLAHLAHPGVALGILQEEGQRAAVLESLPTELCTVREQLVQDRFVVRRVDRTRLGHACTPGFLARARV
jgi:hypothetical protein